ncbi:MAG: WD40 repeat domain-containing protein [Planctomycetia bacterium]|nr:WD40 repeat domain-containing protein [Planctomycetia bacterium]
MSIDQPEPFRPVRKRQWRRFGLRSLFVFVAICAVLVAFVGRGYYRDYLHQIAIVAIEAQGGLVLRRSKVVYRVYLRGDKFDDAMVTELAPHLRNLPELRELDLVESPVTDSSVTVLQQLAHVQEMRIFETRMTKQGIQRLQDSLVHTKLSELPPDPIATGLAMRRIYRHAVVTAAFSRDSKSLYVGNGEGELSAIDVTDGEVYAQSSAHQNWLFCVAISPDGQSLATGGGDNRIRLWDTSSLQLRGELDGHVDDVHGVAFNRTGEMLFSAGDDRTLRAWDLVAQKQVYQIAAHDGSIPSLSYSGRSNLVATGSRDHTVKLWDADSGAHLRTLSEHTDDVNAVAFSDDGSLLASGSYDGTVRIWEPSGQKSSRVLSCGDCRVHAVRFSHDAKHVAAASSDGGVRIWEVATGELARSLSKQDCPANLAFSNDGHNMASMAADGSVALWRSESEPVGSYSFAWKTFVIPTYVAGR